MNSEHSLTSSRVTAQPAARDGATWFDAAPVAMLVAAHGGAVVQVNAQACVLLGRDAEAVRGQTLDNLLPGFSVAACLRSIAAGHEFDVDLPSPSPDATGLLRVRVAMAGSAELVATLERKDGPGRRPFDDDTAAVQDIGLLVDKLPVFIAYYDKDWRYRFVNACYEAWLGRPREWFLGRPIDEVIDSATFRTIEPHVRKALTGCDVHFEFTRQMTQDDGPRHLICHLVSDVREDGEVAGAFALYEDITGRRRAEAAAERAQWEMQAVADHLPALVAYVDGDLRYRYVNRSFEQWYRKPREWFIGRHVEEVVGEAFAHTGPLLRRAAAGEFMHFDYPRHNPVFEQPERTLRVQLVPDPARADGGFIALMEDVTDERAAGHAQRRAANELRNVIDTVPALLAAYDMEARLSYANQTFIEWAGGDGSELPGKPIETLFPDDVIAQVRPGLDAVLRGRQVTVGGHVTAARADGTQPGYFHVEFKPLVENEAQRGFVAFALDVTDTVLALRAVREQAALLRQVTEGSSQGFVLSDTTRRQLLYVSPGVSRMWPDLDAAGGDWLACVHEDDVAAVAARFDAVLRRGGFEARYRVRTADGSERWIHDKADVVRPPDGTGLRLATVLSDITDGVRQQVALDRHARRLAEAQRAGQLGLWELDVGSGDIYWSSQLRRMFEIDQHDFSVNSETYGEFVHPDDLPRVLERVERALKGEQDYDVEHRVRLRSGRVLHLLSQARVERHVDGRPARMVGIVRDVTARKEAELALKLSEERLRRITETIDDVFWLIEVGRPETMYVSPGFVSLFGRPVAEAGGGPADWLEWVHPQDRARMSLLFEGLSQARDYVTEYRILRPDGSERWLLEKAHVVPGRSGDAIQVAGLATDITARKQAEIARAASESMLRQITENTRDLFWLMDAIRGEVIYVGAGFARVWGYPVEAAVDPVPWLDRVHGDDAESTRVARVTMLTTGTADFEYRIVRPDHELRWLHTRAFPIRDASGRLERIAGFTEDVTDSRSLHELRRLKEEAESASRTNSEFLSRMSHELRTPLNAVLGFEQLLLANKDDALSAEQGDSVGEILRAGRHLLEIVNEMLDLTRIEMGHLRIELETLVVQDIVNECVSMLQAQADAREVVIRRVPPPEGIGLAIADRTRVRQIVLNLLSNAIKYNVRGGSVEVSLGSPRAHVLTLTVRDSGTGLDSEQLEQLFVPFRRLDRGNVGDGVGLGLALSKQLAEAMGGSIRAEGQAGVGCAFHLDLPCT